MCSLPGDDTPEPPAKDTVWKEIANHEPPRRELPHWLRRNQPKRYAIKQAKDSRPKTPEGRIRRRAA